MTTSQNSPVQPVSPLSPLSPLPPLSAEAIERLARKRAGAKIGWYIHALVFVLVNLGVFAMSEYAFGHRHWSIKPFLGWGLGLTLHGVAVFWLGKGSGFRERMVAKERARLVRMQDPTAGGQ